MSGGAALDKQAERSLMFLFSSGPSCWGTSAVLPTRELPVRPRFFCSRVLLFQFPITKLLNCEILLRVLRDSVVNQISGFWATTCQLPICKGDMRTEILRGPKKIL